MADDSLWHDKTLARIRRLLDSDVRVLGLAVYGSVAREQADVWSDLDLLIVIAEDALDQFYPTVDWLRPVGEILGNEQSVRPYSALSRVCLKDLRCLDCIITTEARLVSWASESSVPFSNGIRTVFSRSSALDRFVQQSFSAPSPSLMSTELFDRLVEGFWFRAKLAITKVVRGDLLVASHLALGLMRECLELAMLLRDRRAGTNIHRGEGYIGELRRLDPISLAISPLGILSVIERSAVQFDDLAVQWSPAYTRRLRLLKPAIEDARRAVEAGSG